MKYFSDIVIDFLKQQGIEYVCFNPGASFRGLHDSLVVERDDINGQPLELVMCCHEEISVAIAHGYYKASGRHMAILVHANIGLLHASMAMFNGWCDRVPLLVIGGNGPIDSAKRRPWIDWIHTSQHVDSTVKDFVKWSDQPVGQRATLESLYRAFRLMNTEPSAPVYVAIDAETQEEPLASDIMLSAPIQALASVLPPVADDVITQIIGKMLDATLPVIVVDFTGRNPAAVQPLIELAEATGAAVVDKANRFNFPNTHPLSLIDGSEDAITAADFVLALDVQDLWGALTARWESGDSNPLFIAAVGLGDLLVSKWAADYQRLVPIDLPLIGDSCQTLQRLAAAVKQSSLAADPGWNRKRHTRAARIADLHHTNRTRWRAHADERRSAPEIDVTSALVEIHAALKAEKWVLTNTGSVTVDSWVKRLWDIDRTGSYLGLSGGAGLGYGLGASVGAALAHKDSDSICVNLQSDGDLLYTPSAFWTLSQYAIPLLTIVMNNRLYLNSQQHAEQIARLRSRNTIASVIGTSFYDNPVDFLKLADSFNILVAKRLTELEQIQPAVRAAVDHIKSNRRPVVVELVMS